MISIRILIVEENDTIKRLPLAHYQRLLKRDPNEGLPKYAGKRVRCALIVVDLINRRPRETVKDEYAFFNFDDNCRLKTSKHEKEESLAFDMLSFISLEKQDKRAVDARHNFAKKTVC
jgi:hypothetical protein